MPLSVSEWVPVAMPQQDAEHETRWITRRIAARILGISLAGVRRREGREIPVRVDDRGVHLLDRQAIVALQRQGIATPTSPGERTAFAFRLLRDGASLVELTIALRLTVLEAQSLADDFLRMQQSPATELGGDHRSRLAGAGIDARTVAELVDVAVSLASRTARTEGAVKRKGVAA